MFQFKQFTIRQTGVSMKVNTDGVLLGAWAPVDGAETIVDVGAGTGVIALMLAQRNASAVIDAVEIDVASARQAQTNVTDSPWSTRVNVRQQSFQDFTAQCAATYDLVVSNPPYFVDALLSPSQARTLARHAGNLSHNELISCSKKILAPHGRLCVVLPFSEGLKFIALADAQQLFCTRKTTVYSSMAKPPKRLLLQFSLQPVTLIEDELAIHESGNIEYTEPYKNLTKEFYLNF